MKSPFKLTLVITVTAFSAGCSKNIEPMVCLSDLDAAATQDINGGQVSFGENRYYANEKPVQLIEVQDFNIDRADVTNREFQEFVEATGYVTDAERGLSEKEFPNVPAEFRVPGSMVFVSPDSEQKNASAWWQFIAGANWRHPLGPNSSIDGKDAFPVVQVTYDDALAYANWIGRRLPTEAEWEYASRGGLERASYSWGEEPPHQGISKANTWQGNFPFNNMKEDGFVGSSPVGCFPANGYGLYDMTGNVWEWTETAYGPDHQRDYGQKGYDPLQPGIEVKTLKGGSFLCSDNYCQRFRPASRQGQDLTVATSHIGFRTAK